MNLLPVACSANMQHDAAAFEAWALAFMAHCGVRELTIVVPQGVQASRHFERLRYRLGIFQRLFPSVVTVQGVKPWSSLGRVLKLNKPYGRPAAAASEAASRLTAIPQDIAQARSESALEKALEVSPAFRAAFGLEKLMRQWPVGLFEGSIGAGSHVFTGAKSAIDLIGIRGETLVVFELKTATNRKAGILSELLFYASVMRDALGRGADFELTGEAARHCEVAPDDINACSEIEAVLIAPSFNQIASGKVLALLNEAASQWWPSKPVRFEQAIIKAFSAAEFSLDQPVG